MRNFLTFRNTLLSNPPFQQLFHFRKPFSSLDHYYSQWMGNNSNHLLLSCSLFPSRELKNQFRGFFCLLFENLFHLATFEICDKAEKGKHFGANKKTIFFISSETSSRCKSFKALLKQQWMCLQPWYIALAYEWNYIWRWRWIIHGVWKLGSFQSFLGVFLPRRWLFQLCFH